MFGMKKGLKAIKLLGSIKSFNTDYRDVVFRDVDGNDVHFQGMVVAKSLQAKLAVDLPCTFYILRYKNAQNLVGALYAMEVDGVKIYSETEAFASCRTLALSNSSRYGFLSGSDNLRLTYNALCLGVGSIIFMSCISLGRGALIYLFGPLGIFLTSIFGWFSWYPIIRKDIYSGIPEIKRVMEEAGFISPVYQNFKY